MTKLWCRDKYERMLLKGDYVPVDDWVEGVIGDNDDAEEGCTLCDNSGIVSSGTSTCDCDVGTALEGYLSVADMGQVYVERIYTDNPDDPYDIELKDVAGWIPLGDDTEEHCTHEDVWGFLDDIDADEDCYTHEDVWGCLDDEDDDEQEDRL